MGRAWARNESQINILPYTKTHLRWITDANIKYKTLNILGKKNKRASSGPRSW